MTASNKRLPTQVQLILTKRQRAELIDLRDHAPKPYLRERAAALLNIARARAAQVATGRLLKKRWHRTAGHWVEGFKSEDVVRLKIKPGRGRKSSYGSQREQPEEAKQDL